MGMRKFGSAAPPFGKVACVVKVFLLSMTKVKEKKENKINKG